MKLLNKIQQELKAPKNKFNSFGKYKYRSCEDILEAVKPLLGNSILTISDEMVEVGGRVYVKATATIKDGEDIHFTTAYAREAIDKKGMDDSQITGTSSSYARKYALSGLFLLDDNQDADATNTHEVKTSPKSTPKPISSEQMEGARVWMKQGGYYPLSKENTPLLLSKKKNYHKSKRRNHDKYRIST